MSFFSFSGCRPVIFISFTMCTMDVCVLNASLEYPAAAAAAAAAACQWRLINIWRSPVRTIGGLDSKQARPRRSEEEDFQSPRRDPPQHNNPPPPAVSPFLCVVYIAHTSGIHTFCSQVLRFRLKKRRNFVESCPAPPLEWLLL